MGNLARTRAACQVPHLHAQWNRHRSRHIVGFSPATLPVRCVKARFLGKGLKGTARFEGLEPTARGLQKSNLVKPSIGTGFALCEQQKLDT